MRYDLNNQTNVFSNRLNCSLRLIIREFYGI